MYDCMEGSKLEEFNHWWIRGSVDPELALPFKRDVYNTILGELGNRFIVSLTGLRRTGKTTLMYQLIQELIEKGVKKEDIVFFSFDEATAKLDDVISTYKEIHGKDLREARTYVFLDEIQKCGNWENELKKQYDLYPKLKFVISGSESLFIKRKAKETLAGRLLEFHIQTFTFREYLRFRGKSGRQVTYETAVRPLFLEFVRKGGFPETFSIDSDREFREYIRSLVVDKIVYKDIPETFRINDPGFLATLLELVSTNPGMYVNYESLSGQFGKDRRVIKDYFSYLTESFLIRMLGNYRRSSMAALRKSKRAYPSDTALSYLYKHSIDDAFFGKMVETAIVNGAAATSFWKKRGEVDIVRNGMPIEVKYQETIREEDFRPMQEFMEEFGAKEGIVITKKDERETSFGGKRIRLVPAWKWL